MRIGKLELENPLILAPLAGITDSPFRLLMRHMGCGLVYSGLASAEALLRWKIKEQFTLRFSPEEHPLALQIFGGTPSSIARGTEMLADLGADIIDLNLGCTMPKITRGGGGTALALDSKRLEEVMRAMRASTALPLSVKTRLGSRDKPEQFLKIAELALKHDFQALALHCRTVEQKFGGAADWEKLRALKPYARDITLIGNGDIQTPQQASYLLHDIGCHGVMIGRAALKDPWLFKKILGYLKDGSTFPPPALSQRQAFILDLLALSFSTFGETKGLRYVKPFVAWSTKSLPHGTRLRESIQHLRSLKDLEAKLQHYFAGLEAGTSGFGN